MTSQVSPIPVFLSLASLVGANRVLHSGRSDIRISICVRWDHVWGIVRYGLCTRWCSLLGRYYLAISVLALTACSLISKFIAREVYDGHIAESNRRARTQSENQSLMRIECVLDLVPSQMLHTIVTALFFIKAFLSHVLRCETHLSHLNHHPSCQEICQTSQHFRYPAIHYFPRL